MLWAEVPSAGWSKWNWAFKSILFSAFIPWAIRSRVQIEALVQVYVLALAANFIPFAAKVLISGGGYGHNLGLQTGNANLAEGELLSAVVLMAIPLALYLGRHTQLLPRTRLITARLHGIGCVCLLTALGTHERSALVGIVGLGGYMLMRSQHKMAFGLCLAADWHGHPRLHVQRVVRTDGHGEQCVRGQLRDGAIASMGVDHQIRAGTSVRRRIQCLRDQSCRFPSGHVEFGRAYQSIYFEMLGAHGWLGLALFLGVTSHSFIGLRRLARRTRTIPHLVWCADLSNALQAGMVVFMTAGAFVDIAFQPEIWYFIALTISLREYVRRAEQKPPFRCRDGACESWPERPGPGQ